MRGLFIPTSLQAHLGCNVDLQIFTKPGVLQKLTNFMFSALTYMLLFRADKGRVMLDTLWIDFNVCVIIHYDHIFFIFSKLYSVDLYPLDKLCMNEM